MSDHNQLNRTWYPQERVAKPLTKNDIDVIRTKLLRSSMPKQRLGKVEIERLKKSEQIKYLGSPAETRKLAAKNKTRKEMAEPSLSTKDQSTAKALFPKSPASSTTSKPRPKSVILSSQKKLDILRTMSVSKDDSSVVSSMSDSTMGTLNRSARLRFKPTHERLKHTIGAGRHPEKSEAAKKNQERFAQKRAFNKEIDALYDRMISSSDSDSLDPACIAQGIDMLDKSFELLKSNNIDANTKRFPKNVSVSVGNGTAGLNGSMRESTILKAGNRSQAAVPPDNLKGSSATPSKGRCFDEKEGRPSLANQASMQHQLNLPGNGSISSSIPAVTTEGYAYIYPKVHGGSITPRR